MVLGVMVLPSAEPSPRIHHLRIVFIKYAVLFVIG
jgi:hypothetical protein